MKNKMIFFVLLIAVFFASIAVPNVEAAGKLADGTYKANYTILKGDNDSASMANDYFLKPATLNVKNGTIQVQIKVKQSDWIKELSINGSPVKVVSQDSASDTRVIQFSATDLSKPVESKMHVLIEDYNYDNKYTVRFSFDMSGIQGNAAAPAEKNQNTTTEKTTTSDKSSASDKTSSTDKSSTTEKTKNSEKTTTSDGSSDTTTKENNQATKSDSSDNSQSEPVANPKTGDNTGVGILIVLLLSSLGLAYKLKAKRI
ncbi:heme uptake protein IsdC [Peribacillus sp. NPDC096379]|uniref:heme uptake protein IsdC n=1 Tax=Peribacillus sp. NPDC096379 TaxID=3364393 RepID=UPI0037F85A20